MRTYLHNFTVTVAADCALFNHTRNQHKRQVGFDASKAAASEGFNVFIVGIEVQFNPEN